MSNAVRHAYDPGETGRVHVAADVENAALEVVVGDEGHGFRPGHDDTAAGLGLSVIASSTADFGIAQREPRGTEVWMRFLLPR